VTSGDGHERSGGSSSAPSCHSDCRCCYLGCHQLPAAEQFGSPRRRHLDGSCGRVEASTSSPVARLERRHQGGPAAADQRRPVVEAADVARILLRIKAWSTVKYSIERSGVPMPTVDVGTGAEPSYYQYLVGLAYLAIGLLCIPPATRKGAAFLHLVPCAFILSTFHYTGSSTISTRSLLGNRGRRPPGPGHFPSFLSGVP